MTYIEFIRGLKDRDIYLHFKPLITFLNINDNKDKFVMDFCNNQRVSSPWLPYGDIFEACKDIVLANQPPFSILDYCLWRHCAHGKLWEETFYSNHAKFRTSW